MTKKLLPLALTLVSSCILLPETHAAEIDLTIVGKGKVTVTEDDYSCSESCNINNTLTKSTLVASADSGYTFEGWTGQSCPSGNGVLISDSRDHIGSAQGGAKTLSAADVNGDLFSDLASISLFDGNVRIMINRGNGSFDTEVIAADLHYPASLDFFDWDNDGDQDLLVAEYGAKKIKLFLNDSTGAYSFSKDITIPNASPYAIAVEDINGDKEPDLLVSSFDADISGDLFQLVNSIEAASVNWHINNGLDSFSLDSNVSNIAAITLDTSTSATTQKLIVVAAEIQQGDIALYSEGQEQYARKVINSGGGAYGAAFGDLDKDGIDDVLSAHYRPSALKVVYGQTGGEFSDSSLLLTANDGLTATALADINGNSFLDVMSGEFNAKTFFSLTHHGYRECIVDDNGNIRVTANFVEDQATTQDPVAVTSPPVTTEKTESGGGGSVPISLLLFIFFLATFRRNKAVK